MTCPVSNQIADYCNQPEPDCCPECDAFLEEKYLTGSKWLECSNPQCGYCFDLDDDWDV